MARFRITRSRLDAGQMVFEVDVLSGRVAVGQDFSLWDCQHRFDFRVSKVEVGEGMTRLICASEFLRYMGSEEKWPDLFTGKEVDTDDPRVAQRFSHRWGSR